MLAELPLALTRRGPRDAPVRHQTLRATIEWSDRLLTAAERSRFRRLAVFAGGCTLDAATAVGGATHDELDDLVRASLLRRSERGPRGSRWSMLATIRAYATEVLDASGESDTIRRRHVEHFVAVVEALQPLREDRLAVVDAELDNIRTALAFAADHRMPGVQLRLCAMLWRFWFVRGLLSEGAAYIEAALAADEGNQPGPRAGALRAAAVIAWAQGDFDAAKRFAGDSLDLYEALGDEVGTTRALISMGLAAQSLGELAEAHAMHERTLRLARRLGLPVEVGAALANLGDIALLRGDHGRARELYGESLAQCHTSEDVEGTAVALMYLGLVSLWQDDGESDAAALFAESLQLFSGLGFTHLVGACLTGMAAAVVDRDAGVAARLLGAADALREGTTSHMEAWWERPLAVSTEDAARTRLGASSFATAFDRGRTDPHEATGDALASVERTGL